MNLYECKTTHNGESKNFIVQADSFAGAEQAFNQFANNNLNTDYVLNSIHKSDNQLAVSGNNSNDTGNTPNLNSKPEHNRIGFNVDALHRQVRPTYSHEVIIFD
ncbi:MAG: hypothetical protein J6L03_05510 [Bacteroidaceae bacterium]|nr:hypothetical protein [Bacteroidaceae bacterium]